MRINAVQQMKHFNVIFKPDGKEISIHAGATLIEAASQAGIILNSVCGGKGICQKCVLQLEPRGQRVLACQHVVQNDLTVTIPADSRFFEQKILEHGIDRQIKVHPTVCKRYLKQRLCHGNPKVLEANLNKASSNQVHLISSQAADQLKQLDLHTLSEGLTAICHLDPRLDDLDSQSNTYTVRSFERGDTTGKIFGLTVDVGTTTVVAKLINMADGRCEATQATINPQSQYGDDVVNRIAYAKTGAKLDELNSAITECINGLTVRLCGQACIDAKYIYEMCVVGNTTMNHIFLRLPITQLGRAPYEAFSLDAHDVRADELKVEMNPAGNIHTVENIAGFVGGDTIAVALAVDMDGAEDVTLAVDIGTNGELVLGTKDKLYAVSCAAGPAFEGARIRCGSRAAEGAIEAIVVNNGDIVLDVIGNCAPRSICGSGLIDAVAVLLDLGIIDATGRFIEPGKVQDKLPAAILSRIIEKDGQPAFLLAKNADGRAVYLTQRDIREVQLAKGAIRTGFKILLNRFDLEDSDIKLILLAGAFGNYIRPESALRIGLLPHVPVDRIRFVGNAASSGARMILLSRQCRARARQLARKIEYIEIAHEPEFQAVFADSMVF